MNADLIWLSLMFLPFLLATLWLNAQVAKKAGFSGWWCLIMMVPVVNLVVLWVFAFIEWPAQVPRKDAASVSE